MNWKGAPQRILYDTLKETIAGRTVKAGVFLTFQFDPSFFEIKILPALFDSPWSNIEKVQLVQLEECLRSVNNLAVYYDRRGLISSKESAKLDYRRVPLSRKTGFFHPKVILLLLENQRKEETFHSLLTCVTSANLTLPGWWENLEVFQLLEVATREKCPYRQDLRDLIARIHRESQATHDHAALKEIQNFVVHHLEDSGRARKQGKWLPRLYVGLNSFEEFASTFVERGAFNLEIISPYFDRGGTESGLKKLLDACEPKETRIFLPLQNDGVAATTQKYFNLVKKLPRTKWAKLPPELLQRGPKHLAKLAERPVHAKFYRFWNQDREILFVGSANLTNSGFSPGKAGNFEVVAMVEPSGDSSHTWWTEPIGNQEPDRFLKTTKVQEDSTQIYLDITFRFHWNKKTLAYFCEDRGAEPPARVVVSATASKLFQITQIRFGRWVELAKENAQHVESILKSTSFLNVKVDESEPFSVLVQEEGMDQKPSLLRELTAEEILNYWSLLSPEQRERFLLQRILTANEMREEGIVIPGKASQDSMFDRFAGIFHAFNQLEQHVTKALEAKRERDAAYRLLGEKHDSLPVLVRKVLETKGEDVVNRYVTLLSARQLLDRIASNVPDFAAHYRTEFKKVRKSLEGITEVRKNFTFGSHEERAQFFEWFDRMFLARTTREAGVQDS